MKHLVVLTVEIEADDYQSAMQDAQNLAAGLGDSEQTLVDLHMVANGNAAILVNAINTQDIQDAIEYGAEPTAAITVMDVVERIQSMYEANAHEDLKWAIQDIEETS